MCKSPRREIQGFRLEVADIIVRSKSPTDMRGASVQLSTDVGRVEPLTLVLDDSGTGRGSIRSVSTGTANVTAIGPLFAAGAKAGVTFAVPWSFLISAILGGLAGGVLRKGTDWRAGARRNLLQLLAAIITGMIVFGLFALGVNLLAVKLPQQGGEVLVFVVSALGAFAGSKLLPVAQAPGG